MVHRHGGHAYTMARMAVDRLTTDPEGDAAGYYEHWCAEHSSGEKAFGDAGFLRLHSALVRTNRWKRDRIRVALN